MPFKSDSQRKLCYLLKGKGQAGSWDCDEWSTATGKKDLPEHVEDQAEKKALEHTNKLPGGVGDNKKPSDFPKGVLDGMYEEEKIHTSDPDIATELAIDHLTQDKDHYKNLKKVEKESSLSAVKALCSLWSGPSPLKTAAERTLLSKLSSVITSPGRGSGDEEETAINPDSAEGMQPTKPIKPISGKTSFNQKGLKPVAPLGTARNALRNATESELGFDPAGGVKQAQTKLYQLAKGIPGNMYRSMFGNKPAVPRAQRPKKDWELSDFVEEYPELKTLNFQDLYRQAEQRVLNRMVKEHFHGSPESLYAGGLVLDNNDRGQSTKQAEGPSYMQQVYQNFANPVKTVGEFGKAFHGIMDNVDETTRLGDMASRQQAQLSNINRNRGNPGTQSFDTMPNRNFDFSTLSSKARLDPSILGTAPARGFDFANMKKSLQNAGRQAGEAATSGVEHWVKSPGITSPMEVWKRRNQALGAQKSIGSAVDSAGKAISGIQSGAQRVGSGLMSSGSSLMGMGKQSDVTAPSAGATPAPKAAAPAPKAAAPAPVASSNNSNAFSGAASGVGDAFSAGFGNQDALKRVQDDLNRPNLSELNSKFKDFADRTSNSFNYASKNYKGPSGYEKFQFGIRYPELAADVAMNGTKKYTDSFSSMNPFASMTPAISHGANALGGYASMIGAQSEGRRMAAGVTMPVLNFMQNNPWAKYLLGALGTGVAGYGLHSMFGGQQKQQNGQAESVLQNSYNQGLKGA